MSNPANASPLPSWNDITPKSLALPRGSPKNSQPTDLEPSGLTIYEDGGHSWIFLVSDNGKLTKAKLDDSQGGNPGQTSWRTPLQEDDPGNHGNDYECVTFAKGNLMIGVEGDRSEDGGGVTAPKILRFDQTKDGRNSSTGAAGTGVGQLTGNSWQLDGCLPEGSKENAGMEALTFVPNGSYPSDWASSPHYGGVFLVAVQAQKKKIFVYDLPGGSNADGSSRGLQTVNPVASGTGLSGGTLTVPVPSSYTDANLPADTGKTPLLSDLFFDAAGGVLYALYDGGSTYDYLQALSLDTSTGTLTELWCQRAPWYGCEGVAVDGDDLYIAIDNNNADDQSDGVYQLPGFISAASG
jgi:hypothetical protein